MNIPNEWPTGAEHFCYFSYENGLYCGANLPALGYQVSESEISALITGGKQRAYKLIPRPVDVFTDKHKLCGPVAITREGGITLVAIPSGPTLSLSPTVLHDLVYYTQRAEPQCIGHVRKAFAELGLRLSPFQINVHLFVRCLIAPELIFNVEANV